MRTGGEFSADDVAGANFAAFEHNAHDTAFDPYTTIGIAVEQPAHQSWPKRIDLPAGIAQAGDLDDRICAQMQARARRQFQQLQTARRDVLADSAGKKLIAGSSEFFEQLGMYQMHLAQIRPRWIFTHTYAMLHLCSGMCVTADANTGDQFDDRLIWLCEAMFRVAADRNDFALQTHIIAAHGPFRPIRSALPQPREESRDVLARLFFYTQSFAEILDRPIRIFQIAFDAFTIPREDGAAASACQTGIHKQPADRFERHRAAIGAPDRPLVVITEHARRLTQPR